MTEVLLAQHLESPSRTGRGRVPEPSTATLPAAPATTADTQNSTTPILTGQSARVVEPRFVVRDDGIVEAHIEPTDGVMDQALNDAVSSRAPRGATHQGLSTYWIDRVHAAVLAAESGQQHEPFAAGNVTTLRRDGDRVVAAYDFDPDEEEAESLSVADFLSLLDRWRDRVIEAGGVSGEDARRGVEESRPRPRPMGPTSP